MSENKEKSKNSNHDDRRSSQRIDARIEVSFRNNQEFIQCYAQNLSQGGIYLETAILPDPNANIELNLDLDTPGAKEKLGKVSLTGKVVRLMSMSVSGKMIHKVAVQFIDTPPHIQAKIDALYHRLSGSES